VKPEEPCVCLFIMTTNKPDSLENFVERHRADFDAHEPRPDLWAALEQELAGSVVAPTEQPTMIRTVDTTAAPQASPAAPRRGTWVQRYGMAAALAALVFAAGVGEAWKSTHKQTEATLAEVASSSSNEPDAALYMGHEPQALTAAQRSDSNSIQLTAAVRGMEAYYASQLARRQAELNQMGGPGAAGMAADYQHELASLDSSYRVLKQELPQHPQPEAVLTAMNRNLQIRLDILDQQLHLSSADETDRNTGAFVLADSRHLPQ
jgi:hypothetical protein